MSMFTPSRYSQKKGLKGIAGSVDNHEVWNVSSVKKWTVDNCRVQ